MRWFCCLPDKLQCSSCSLPVFLVIILSLWINFHKSFFFFFFKLCSMFSASRRVSGLRGADLGGGQIHCCSNKCPGKICLCRSEGAGGTGQGECLSSHNHDITVVGLYVALWLYSVQMISANDLCAYAPTSSSHRIPICP